MDIKDGLVGNILEILLNSTPTRYLEFQTLNLGLVSGEVQISAQVWMSDFGLSWFKCIHRHVSESLMLEHVCSTRNQGCDWN